MTKLEEAKIKLHAAQVKVTETYRAHSDALKEMYEALNDVLDAAEEKT